MRFGFISAMMTLLLLSSCIRQREYIYFNKSKAAPIKDSVHNSISRSVVPDHILGPGDQVNVIVATDVPVENSISSINTGNAAGTGSGVFIQSDGHIIVPLIGKVRASGMTVKVFQDSLLVRLKQFYKSPYVRVDMLSFKVTVMGEVKQPGQKVIAGDHATVLEALAMAGDLGENAKRQNVRVMRQDGNGVKEIFIDLASIDVFNSEGYYLQSNDIIYVAPYGYTRYLSKTQQIVFFLNTIAIFANVIVLLRR